MKRWIESMGAALLCIVLAAPLVLGAGGGASAAETMDVKAYGSATAGKTAATTRKEALDDAVRDAVVSAVKEYLEKNGISADEKALAARVYSRAADFVLNYRVLSERWISETPQPLEPSGGAVGEGVGQPGAPGPRASGRPPGEGAGAQEEGPLPGGVPGTPPEAAEQPPTFHVLINATVDMDSLRKAVTRVIAGSEGGVVRLVMLDISDYDTFRALTAALGRIPMIEDLSYRSFARNRFVATVHSVLDPATLAQEIGREAGPDFVATAYGRGTVIIKAFPGPAGP